MMTLNSKESVVLASPTLYKSGEELHSEVVGDAHIGFSTGDVFPGSSKYPPGMVTRRVKQRVKSKKTTADIFCMLFSHKSIFSLLCLVSISTSAVVMRSCVSIAPDIIYNKNQTKLIENSYKRIVEKLKSRKS